jgi:hypothetical protein
MIEVSEVAASRLSEMMADHPDQSLRMYFSGYG